MFKRCFDVSAKKNQSNPQKIFLGKNFHNFCESNLLATLHNFAIIVSNAVCRLEAFLACPLKHSAKQIILEGFIVFPSALTTTQD